MITLDTATLWLYPLFLLAGLVLVSCVSVLVTRAIRQDQANRKDRTPYVLVAITSSVTLFFCFQTMFLRFRGVEVKPEHIELVYAWPRPRMLIPSQSFQRAEVFRDRKNNGHLEVVTKDRVFRSTGFSRTVNAEEVKSSLEKWAVSRR